MNHFKEGGSPFKDRAWFDKQSSAACRVTSPETGGRLLTDIQTVAWLGTHIESQGYAINSVRPDENTHLLVQAQTEEGRERFPERNQGSVQVSRRNAAGIWEEVDVIKFPGVDACAQRVFSPDVEAKAIDIREQLRVHVFGEFK